MVSDRRGLITGIACKRFGAGALITAPVATELIQRVGVLSSCLPGIAYLIVTVAAGLFIRIRRNIETQRLDANRFPNRPTRRT